MEAHPQHVSPEFDPGGAHQDRGIITEVVGKGFSSAGHRVASQAFIALARRRGDVTYAMLRDGTLYETQTPAAA